MQVIPLVIAVVDRGPMDKPSRAIAPHEIPLLEMIHGGGGVTLTHEPCDLTLEITDPDAEYDRLLRKYGEDEKTGIPIVERVYGREDAFARDLESQYSGTEAKPVRKARKAS